MLDCLHGNGPAALERQHVIAAACARVWSCEVHASPTGPAAIDALFSSGGVLTAVAEIKARDLSLRALQRMRPAGYLISLDKLRHGRTIAKALGVMFVVIVGLDADGLIVWWPISNGAGQWQTTFSTAYTETAATCNGGTARRLNAYLSLTDMHLLDGALRWLN